MPCCLFCMYEKPGDCHRSLLDVKLGEVGQTCQMGNKYVADDLGKGTLRVLYQ